MRSALLATATALALSVGTAHATITFIDSDTGGIGEQTIMFEKADTSPAQTQTGDTNRTNSPVIFDTTFAKATGSNGGAGTGQFIKADGIGQANLECSGSPTSCPNLGTGNDKITNALTSIEMKPGGGFAWTDAILNTDSGIGTVNVFVKDQMGGQFDDTLKKGQNFVTILASAGEVITDIQVSQESGTAGPFGWEKFKQPRVSGVCTMPAGSTTCTPIPVPVPEPAGIAAFGVGLCGLLLVRRAYKARSPNL